MGVPPNHLSSTTTFVRNSLSPHVGEHVGTTEHVHVRGLRRLLNMSVWTLNAFAHARYVRSRTWQPRVLIIQLSGFQILLGEIGT
jgi:hypothetical protein